MAFTIQNWARASVSMNEPIQSVTDTAVSASPVIEGCFREYNYYSPVDTCKQQLQLLVISMPELQRQGVVFDFGSWRFNHKVYSLTENSLVSFTS